MCIFMSLSCITSFFFSGGNWLPYVTDERFNKVEMVGLFHAYNVVEFMSVCEELRDLLYVALL